MAMEKPAWLVDHLTGEASCGHGFKDFGHLAF